MPDALRLRISAISDLLLLLFCFLGRSMQIYEISLGDEKKKAKKISLMISVKIRIT